MVKKRRDINDLPAIGFVNDSDTGLWTGPVRASTSSIDLTTDSLREENAYLKELVSELKKQISELAKQLEPQPLPDGEVFVPPIHTSDVAGL